MPHPFDGNPGYFRQERLVQSQSPAEERRPPQQTAQHVAPPLVAGNYAVADKKGDTAAVLGNHPHGAIHSGLSTIALAG